MKKVLYIIMGIILVVVLISAVTNDLEDNNLESDHAAEKENKEIPDKDEGIEEEEEEVENSRTNPAGLNETVTVERDDFLNEVTYEIELMEIVSGEEAWNIVSDANEFNEKPEDGKEYILAKFRIKILETKEDESYGVSDAQFDAVSEDGVAYDKIISVSGVNPSISTDLYEGGEHVGYTYFLVEKEDSPVAAIHRDQEGEAWFDLSK